MTPSEQFGAKQFEKTWSAVSNNVEAAIADLNKSPTRLQDLFPVVTDITDPAGLLTMEWSEDEHVPVLRRMSITRPAVYQFEMRSDWVHGASGIGSHVRKTVVEVRHALVESMSTKLIRQMTDGDASTVARGLSEWGSQPLTLMLFTTPTDAQRETLNARPDLTMMETMSAPVDDRVAALFPSVAGPTIWVLQDLVHSWSAMQNDLSVGVTLHLTATFALDERAYAPPGARPLSDGIRVKNLDAIVDALRGAGA